MNRAEFKNLVKHHDWYYAYSDDHNVWVRGSKSLAALQKAHSELACPFSMRTLSRWVANMILEEFVEEEPNKYWRQPRQTYVAPATRDDLIFRAEWNQVESWMNQED